MSDPAEPTVFIIDDDPDMARSLSWLVRSAGLKAEVAESAERFLSAFDPERPGCILLDIRMPGMSGMEMHDCLREKGPTPPVIFVTGHGDVPLATRAFKSGAFDFIEKPFPRQALIERINQAIRQDARGRQHRRQHHDVAGRLDTLTRRERQVFSAVIQGRLNKQIAQDLHISIKTVEVHRANVMAKMGVDSLAELVRTAVDHQLA